MLSLLTLRIDVEVFENSSWVNFAVDVDGNGADAEQTHHHLEHVPHWLEVAFNAFFHHLKQHPKFQTQLCFVEKNLLWKTCRDRNVYQLDDVDCEQDDF